MVYITGNSTWLPREPGDYVFDAVYQKTHQEYYVFMQEKCPKCKKS